MSLIAALAQMLNSGGHTAIGGALGKAGNIAGNFLSGNPGYMDAAMNESDLQSKQIANQNAPLMNALQQQLLQSKVAGSNLKNQYMPQTIQSKNALQNAQAGMIGAKLQDPYYGKTMPGPAGQMQGLELLKQRYGENSPQYQQSLKAFDTLTKYRDKIADNKAFSSLPSLVKMQAVANTLQAGGQYPMAPNMAPQGGMQQSQQQPNALQQAMMQSMQQGQQPQQMQQQQGQPQLSTGSPQLSADNFQQMPPMSDEQRQQSINQLKMAMIKNTSDPKTRQALVMANSIDNTLAAVPMEVVSQFYGPKGRAKMVAEQSKVVAGQSPSPEYQSYLDFTRVDGPALVGQIRQFLGDSVVPSAQEVIKNLVNPSYWANNPETALAQFNRLKKIYEIEKKARMRGINDPSLFTGESSNAAANQSGAQQSSSGQKYSDEDIKHTAQQYGMTESQVRAKLGIK